MDRIVEIANLFDTSTAVGAEPYGCGHINDTYRVKHEDGGYTILQRINDNVFRDVDGLMQNVVGVTEYIAKKALADGTRVEDVLRVIRTKNGEPYAKTEAGFFRTYNFIHSGISIETKATARELRASARSFGKFQKSLDGYPVNELRETIPNFHNTEWRFSELDRAVREDRAGRLKNVEEDVERYVLRKRYAGAVMSLIRSGDLIERVTHNDTKLNNVLINTSTMEPVTVIDLDTVMKGAMAYDFGDSIRTGASTGAEDEKDLTKVGFDLNAYRAYTEGFMSEVGSRLTAVERETIHFGAILMTYECGMRFLTDYLDGDVYFKVHREGHNLDRARTQIKLVEGMEKREDEMRKIVAESIL